MGMDKIPSKFMILIKLAANPSRQRLQEAATGIKEAVETITDKKDYQLVFVSEDGGCFGFLVKASLAARQIRYRVESPGKQDRYGHPVGPQAASPLRDGDAILVIELGDDFDGSRFSRAWTWLQHR